MEKIKSLFSIKWMGYLSLLFLLVTFGYFMFTSCSQSSSGPGKCDIELFTPLDRTACEIESNTCVCTFFEFTPPNLCQLFDCTNFDPEVDCCIGPTPHPD